MGVPFHTARGPIDLADLQPADLGAAALADALAKINRFGGRTPEPWSVAAHSVLVSDLCTQDLKPWALLHDAHKAFLGDLMDPAVELLCQLGTRTAVENAIRNAEGAIDRRIGAAWGIAPRSMSQQLRTVDQVVFLAEVWTFLGAAPGPLGPMETDLFDRAVGALRALPAAESWKSARDRWLGRAEFYAHAGWLSPPRDPQPSSAVLAG